jgi:MFS superfamily sulfate permease-like transporter
VRRLVDEAPTPVRAVLIPAQQINELDSTGADALAKLVAELATREIGISFAEAKSSLRAAMRRTGLEEKIGSEHFYESIEGGVQAFLQPQRETVDQTGEAT